MHHKLSQLMKILLTLTIPILFLGIAPFQKYLQDGDIAHLAPLAITASPSSTHQSETSNGTISPAATGLPNSDSTLPTDPTAWMQTQEAAIDQTHLSGPPLAPGDATVTPTLEPPTNPDPSTTQTQSDQPTSSQSEADSGPQVVPATGAPDNDSSLPANPTAWMQTREASLDHSHSSGPTLAPGDSAATTVSDETKVTRDSSGFSLPCITGMLLGFVIVIKKQL